MQVSRGWFLTIAVVAAALAGAACGGGSQSCAQGEERCACFANSTCNAGLTCLSNKCVNSGGPGGTTGGGGSVGGMGGTSSGSAGTSATGTGGSSAAGTGGSSATGTGGSGTAGAGGSSATGTGGSGAGGGSGSSGAAAGSAGSGGLTGQSYPSSCAAYRVAHPTVVADGTYTLYLAGQTDKPFQAYCADLSTTPSTYLTLVNHSQTVNISNYDATTVGTTTVLTQWTRVRFDTDAIAIVPSDFRFSTSSGYVTHENTTQVPYGVARDCAQVNKALGLANVDLRGLPFSVIPNWTLGGYVPFGMTTITAFYQSVDISGGGSCGWNAPGGDRFGGTSIPLRWCPAPAPEICHDGLDNDCDGVVDNGC